MAMAILRPAMLDFVEITTMRQSLELRMDEISMCEGSSYIGKSITTDGITSELGSSGATWSLSAPRATSKATITISDSKNTVVGIQTQPLSAGTQSFSWDGRTSSGLKAPAGLYTIKVDAVDASGQKVIVDTAVSGKVDGIDLAGSAPALMVGKNRVTTSAIKQVSGL